MWKLMVNYSRLARTCSFISTILKMHLFLEFIWTWQSSKPKEKEFDIDGRGATDFPQSTNRFSELHLIQWLSAFLMLRSFNAVLYDSVTPNHKIIWLLFHNCNFATEFLTYRIFNTWALYGVETHRLRPFDLLASVLWRCDQKSSSGSLLPQVLYWCFWSYSLHNVYYIYICLYSLYNSNFFLIWVLFTEIAQECIQECHSGLLSLKITSLEYCCS